MRRLFLPADGVLLTLLLLAAGGLFIGLSTRHVGKETENEKENRILYTIALDPEGERLVYQIPGEISVTIVCEQGEIWFESSECPDQTCVRSGHLSREGEAAVCLPSGVVIRVLGVSENDGQTG